MIIQPRNLAHYLHTITFPLEIREQGGRPLGRFVQSKDEFLALVAHGRIVGHGTHNRLRFLEINTPDPGIVTAMRREHKDSKKRHKRIVRRLPIAEDNQTVIKESLERGIVYQHDQRHCEAYLGGAVRAMSC